jgi:hypothetical protein
MANHNLPTVTSNYVDVLSDLDGRLDDIAKGLDPATTSATNVPTNSIRWNSASNKWELYNGSTWVDLSTGYNIPILAPLVLTANSSSAALRITQTGSGNSILVEDSANPDSTPFVVDGSGNMGVGTPTPTEKVDVIGTVKATAFLGFNTPRVSVIADATSITIDSDTTDMATQANTQVAGTLTINAPTGSPINGQKLILRIRTSNSQTFSWNAAFDDSSDLNLPLISSGSSLFDYMGFIYNSTTSKWQLLAKVFGF